MRRIAVTALTVVPLAFIAGSIAARFALSGAPSRLAVPLAQPLVVPTAWGTTGALAFAVLALTFALAATALIAALRAASDEAEDDLLPLWPIVLSSAAALAAGFTWPFVFSSDVYAYAAYGDETLHGMNPYLRAPSGAHDAFLDAARLQWGSGSFPACVYGPLFVALATALVRVFGGLAASLTALRVTAALGFISAIYLLDLALAGVERRRWRVAAFALNPVAIWSATEGHNDTLVLAAVLAGVVLLRRARPIAAGIAIGLSPLIKAIGLAAAPIVLVFLSRGRTQERFALAAGVAAAASLALLIPVQSTGLRALAAHGNYAPQFSFQALIGPVPALFAAAAIALWAWPLLRAGDFGGVVRLAIALWLALPNPYPWYTLWVLPIAVAAPRSPERAALWLGTIFAALRYLPDAFGEMGKVPAAALTVLELLPPAAAFFMLRR